LDDITPKSSQEKSAAQQQATNARLNPFFIDNMPQTVQPQADRPRSIPQILSALSRANFSQYVGKQSRISKIYQDFQQFISLDELKQVKQFLDT
jgi:hypothetical protein